MSNDPQTPNQTQSYKASECSKRKINSLSPPNTPSFVYKRTKFSATLISPQPIILISSQPSSINPPIHTTPTSIPTSYLGRRSPKRTTVKDLARTKATSQAKTKQSKGSSSGNLNCSSAQKDEINSVTALQTAEEAGLIMPPTSP